MRLRKAVREAERLPYGYGYAWTEWDTAQHVVYPIPLNIVCGLAYRFWIRCLRFGVDSDPVLKAWGAGYAAGRASGRDLYRAEDEKRGMLMMAHELREAIRG